MIYSGTSLRLEGNYDFGVELENNDSQFSLGLEKPSSETVTWVAEYFYHERGATAVDQYATPSSGLQLPYLGRHYFAFAPSWQTTPLLLVSTSWMISITDWSSQLSLRGEYSLADESTVALNATIATGKKSSWGADQPVEIESEFGSSPALISVELNYYL